MAGVEERYIQRLREAHRLVAYACPSCGAKFAKEDVFWDHFKAQHPSHIPADEKDRERLRKTAYEKA